VQGIPVITELGSCRFVLEKRRAIPVSQGSSWSRESAC